MKNSTKNIKSINKQAKWDKAYELYTNKIGDKLGLGLDKKVVESVVALNLLGFKTTMSCEGHKNWGTGAPYIDIEVKGARAYLEKISSILDKKGVPTDDDSEGIELNSEDFKDFEDLQNKLEEIIKMFSPKLQRILDDFHKTYPSGTFLINKLGGEIRIEPKNIEDIGHKKVTKEELKSYQKELRAFGEFLKNMYFG